MYNENMKIRHTWHPNTFGLLYGKTTKTACSKRRATGELVKPLETTCTECQEVIIENMTEQQEMWIAATDIAKSKGYDSITDYLRSTN